MPTSKLPLLPSGKNAGLTGLAMVLTVRVFTGPNQQEGAWFTGKDPDHG